MRAQPVARTPQGQRWEIIRLVNRTLVRALVSISKRQYAPHGSPTATVSEVARIARSFFSLEKPGREGLDGHLRLLVNKRAPTPA